MIIVHFFRKVVSIAFIGLSFIALQSFYEGGKKLKNTNEISTRVNYIGMSEDYLIFKVSFTKLNSPNTKKVEIRILANDKEEIFTRQYGDDTMTILYKISKAEVETLSFQLINRRTKIQHRFNVHLTLREILEVVPVH